MAASRIPIREKMFDLIEQWKQSGLAKKEFCVRHQIANATFHYWFKKYNQNDDSGETSFVPIHIKELKSQDQPFAELVLPDGRKLTFYNALDASFLKSLLS